MLVSLGRDVWESVQNDPKTVKPYADLLWEGKDDTLPTWNWAGEPKYDCGISGLAEEILFERGVSEDKIYQLLEARKQAGNSLESEENR